MSVDAHKIMAENIADDVFDAFNESSTITKTIEWMFVGDDGECLDGEVEYTAKFVGGGYTVVPNSIKPIIDEMHPDMDLAKIDEQFAQDQLLDEQDLLLEELQDDIDEYLTKDKFMSLVAQKFRQTKDIDLALESIIEEEYNDWYERASGV